MKQYNENNLPILKFLRWRKPLREHPEFLKYKKTMSGYGYADALDHVATPLLWPKEYDRVDPYGILHAQDAVYGLSRVWPEFAEAASGKIEAISKTFATAMENSYDAFLKAELFKELENQDLQGTLIFPDGKVICYDFIIQSPEEAPSGVAYAVEGNAIYLDEGKSLICDAFEDYDEEQRPLGTSSWHDFVNMEYKEPIPEKKEGSLADLLHLDEAFYKISNDDEVNKTVMGMFDCVLVFHLFKKYAPIEELVSVHARRERADVPQIKSSQNIDFLDCSWYTTIVRNQGFNVRGHFRLQPCGVGKKDKKLIYIHEFQKHGYVRRARILHYSDDNQQYNNNTNTKKQ